MKTSIIFRGPYPSKVIRLRMTFKGSRCDRWVYATTSVTLGGNTPLNRGTPAVKLNINDSDAEFDNSIKLVTIIESARKPELASLGSNWVGLS
jgi:hypothetical protein